MVLTSIFKCSYFNISTGSHTEIISEFQSCENHTDRHSENYLPFTCQPSWETEHQILALGREKVRYVLGKLLLTLATATTKYFSP